jgi:putative ABC transport system substrate-binding protein
MSCGMKRREFIVALGASAALLPFDASAQTSGKTIGFLGTTTAAAWGGWVNAFTQRLQDLNWIDGRNIAIEYRWAEGRYDRFLEIASEFARRKLDVIVTSGGAVAAVKQVTQTIPIVFAVANDPVGTGLVASFARPGGNVTGLSLQAPDLSGKRIEILREVVPGLARLGVLGNAAYAASVLEMNEVQDAARGLGLQSVRLEVKGLEDIATAFNGLKSRIDAIYVVTDSLVSTHHTRINSLAVNERLPTMHSVREYVDGGGLLSYGANYQELFRRAADLVDKIFRGARPDELPVEQPSKFELAINLVVAKALGISIPPSIYARADAIIE